MLNFKSLDDCPPDPSPVRPVILLAIGDQDIRATYAYGLSATGFDVMTPDSRSAGQGTRAEQRPDIVVIDLPADCHDEGPPAQTLARNFKTDDIPIVAIAPDFGTASCHRARQAGYAAVCLTTCPAEVLASGLRAVLERAIRHTRQVD